MVYDAATLQQTMIWSSAPDGTPFNGGGIWMAGRAPVIDASNNVYYTTGNGTWDGVTNFGESFVKFGPTPDTPLLDWFTPDDVDFLNNTDLDLGGSGPILVPGTDLIISGGKSGVFYVTHTADMGHRTTNDVGIVQSFDNSNPAGSNDQIKGGPVYWNREGGVGPWMYVWSDGCNHFNAYNFNGTTFDTPPVSQSTVLSQCGSSGGVLTLSANGSTPGSGVLWSSMVKSGDGNSNVHAGILRAFDADDLSTELWNSEQNHGRDDAGNWPKFSAPSVVNGRVYLASFPIDGVADATVNVYGLLAEPDFALAMTPDNPGVAPGGDATYTITTTAANGFCRARAFRRRRPAVRRDRDVRAERRRAARNDDADGHDRSVDAARRISDRRQCWRRHARPHGVGRALRHRYRARQRRDQHRFRRWRCDVRGDRRRRRRRETELERRDECDGRFVCARRRERRADRRDADVDRVGRFLARPRWARSELRHDERLSRRAIPARSRQ